MTPSGSYAADCETGRQYAFEFLKSCDGTIGWSSILALIVSDMIAAGPTGYHADGKPKSNGIVIGFMSVIGRVATVAVVAARAPESIA